MKCINCGWRKAGGLRDAGRCWGPSPRFCTREDAGGVKSLFSLCFQVAAVAGVYEVLNQLGFPELESLEGKRLCTLRGRWQAQGGTSRPFRGDFV